MMVLEVISPSSSNLQAVGSSVPLGSRGLVHVYGSNDMSIAQKLGISWLVWDPDGIVAQEYSAWEDFTSAPGEEHHFRTPLGFDINKSGTWTIEAALFMNQDDPVVVDSYKGTLCTTTLEVPPEYELIQHTIYPYAYVYDGDVEVTTATFRTDPFTPSAWVAQKFADALESEVAKEGGRVLEVEVHVDTTPLLWADFRVAVKSTPLGGAVGVAVGIPLWAAILIIALAIIAVIVAITLSLKTIVSLFTHKPLSEKIKLTWSRGTLMSIIGDFEVKLERTKTPSGELEGMSDGELREYCDQLAEKIEPPEVDWAAVVIIGGIAVLGVGAAIALAAPRKSGGHNPGIATSVAAATLVLEEEKRKKDKKEKPKGLRW